MGGQLAAGEFDGYQPQRPEGVADIPPEDLTPPRGDSTFDTPAPHWTTFVRGERKQRGKMNKTETAYAEYLQRRKLAGEIVEYWYEGITLQLAEGVRYTPDFMLFFADGRIELHEVKGHWDTASKIRIRTAADRFPFRFIAVRKLTKKAGGGWEVEEF